MTSPVRYFLKKDQKLKSRKAIEVLFATGNSFSNFPFRVSWQLTNEHVGIKAGFSASSRNFKKATDRNKIKRLTREAYRLQKNDLENTITHSQKGLHLFFIYIGKEVPNYELVYSKTGIVVKRLIKTIEGIPASIQNETTK